MAPIDRDRCVLLIVDVQERLAPATLEPDRVIGNCRRLLEAATSHGIPALLSEQYPEGIGHSVPALRSAAPDGAVAAKVHFCWAREPGFMARLEALNRRQAVVAGMEAHVCVLQTTLGLAAAGFECFVVEDAVTARVPLSKTTALARLEDCGVGVVDMDAVLAAWRRP